MKQLTVKPQTFAIMLLDFIKSGANFDAKEDDEGNIVVKFDGGY